MKKIIILIFIAVVFAGCNKQDKETEKMYKKYVAKAKTSEIKETKCFLGFQFGMSKEEYYNYMDSLILIKKVYKDDMECYYDYYSDEVKYKLKIIPQFFSDTLFRVNYISDDNFAYMRMFSGFMGSGKGFLPFKMNNIIDEKIKDYYYIRDNMIVEFSQLIIKEGSYMSYSNAPIQYKIDSIEKAKANESTKEF